MGSSSAKSDSIASNGYIEPQQEFTESQEVPLIVEPLGNFSETQTTAGMLPLRFEDGPDFLSPSRALPQPLANDCTDLDESTISTSPSEYLSADRSPSLFGWSTRRSSFSSLDGDDDFQDFWISNIGEQFQDPSEKTLETNGPLEERREHIEPIPRNVIPYPQLAVPIRDPEFHSSSISPGSASTQNITSEILGSEILSSEILSSQKQNIARPEHQISAEEDFAITELSIHSTLWKEMITWPPFDDTLFLPDDVLRREVSVDVIVNNLRQYTKDIPEREIYSMASQAQSRSYKMFAYLCFKKESRHFVDFIREDLTDDDLPFTRSPGDNDGKLYSHCDPKKAIKVLENWTPQRRHSFTRDQWSVLAPIFRDFPEMQHQELDNQCIFPFISDEEFTKPIKSGFASVWMVEIHPAHQHLYTDQSGRKPLVFAIKKLISESQEQFDAEVEMLSLFRNREHPHIVRLLATFRYKQCYHLIFLGAKSNLREFWKTSPNPSFTHQAVHWVLRQCAGIVSGLQAIHVSTRTGSQTQCGRHGDLKPENLLYSYDDMIIIADFGTMDLHGENSTKISPEHIAGSFIYAPPEARLDLGLKISRSYDIWSLACCFIEFMTWLLMGWDGLEELSKLRRYGFGDDTFYIIEREFASSTATIRDSVLNWIQRLHHDPNCSQFCHDFLNLVTNKMLIVNSDGRISCGQLNVEFQEMTNRAENEPNYLTIPVPVE